jgi:hypothetical protein
MGGLGGGGTTAGILVLDAAGGTIESDVNNADLDEPSVIISGAVLSPIQLVGSNQIGNYQQTGEWVVEDGTGSVLNAAGYFIDGGITTISNGAIVSAGGLATVTTTGQLTIANAQVNAVWPIRNSRSFFSRNWFTKSRPLSVAPAGPAYPELRQTASLKHDHSGSAPFAAPKGANELPPGRLRPPTVG